MVSDEARIVFDVLDRLSSIRNAQGVVDTLKSAARTLAGADDALVMLRDGASVHYVNEEGSRNPGERRRLPLESCVSGWVILNRQWAVVEDIASDGRNFRTARPGGSMKSLAAFPIRSADPVGALEVYWKDCGSPDPAVLNTLQTLANAAAIAIENARLFGWVEVAYRSARQEAQKYANLVNTVNGVVWEADPGTLQFTFVSEQAERLLGFPQQAWTARGDFWLGRLHPEDRAWAAEFRQRQANPGDRRHFEYRMLAADGNTVWVADYVSAGRRSDNTECLRGVMVDVTEQKSLERRLEWRLLNDALTSLPNRALFLDRAETELSRRGGSRPQSAPAILLIGLDGFKHINDSFGHVVGDLVLMAVASRLRKSCSRSHTVARLNGDEFAVLAPGGGRPDRARAIAERIHSVFARPFNVAGSTVYLTASIGIALENGIRHSAGDMLREAETAMYRAKSMGLPRSRFFDAFMHEDAVSRLRLESDLRRAIERRELESHYQPIVDLRTHDVLGFEALLRWRHPQRGLLLPSQFMTMAEDLGLMAEVGYQTLTRAGEAIRRWTRRTSKKPWISVNISPSELGDPNLLKLIRGVLNANSIPPDRLKLEITEAGVAQTDAPVRERLGQLHDLGVGILIDDFGTGTSSFDRLLGAPIAAIKIDRRFLEEINSPTSSAPILRSIISLGQNLKVGLIGEGVENEQEKMGLWALGCTTAQGYYFGSPEPLDRAEAMIGD
jgi:diguanylate cyclase (GGDEF)-like protein/PAS domain S-box-containing protein